MGRLVDTAGDDARTRVFLSYSRRDGPLVAQIADGLMAAGFLADFDQAAHDPGNVTAGISAEDEWWKRLQEMIAAADTMVFLVSEHSAASAVCDEEIAWARGLGKRIIAVLARPVDFARAPPRLSALNVRIDFSENGPGFDAALAQLVQALKANAVWHREGRKYASRASEWDTRGRPKSLLLREGAVAEAEAWALARPRNEPEAGELFLAWIAASRAQIRRDAAVRAFWRRVTGLFVLTTLAAVLAGAWFVVSGQRELGRSQSLMLARTSDQFHNSGDHARALQLSILAARDTFLSPTTDEARAAFARSAQASTHIVSIRQEGDPALGGGIAGAELSPDGSRLVTWNDLSDAWLWDMETGELVSEPIVHPSGQSLQGAAFSSDGARLLIWNTAGVLLVDPATGALVAGPIVHPVEAGRNSVFETVFSTDGGWLLTVGGDGAARIWDSATGAPVAALETSGGRTWQADFTGRGRGILVVSDTGARFWDGEVAGPLYPLAGARGAALSADGQALAVWGARGGVVLWDMASGARQDLSGCHDGDTRGALIYPEIARVVSWGGARRICVWDMASGQLVAGPLNSDEWSSEPAVSLSARRLYTFTQLTGGRLTDLVTGEALPPPDEAATLAQGRFTPDGRLLTQAGEFVHIWDPETFTMALISIRADPDSEMADISADGRLLVMMNGEGFGDAYAQIYDINLSSELGAPVAHSNFLYLPHFVKAGTQLVKGGAGLLTISGNTASLYHTRPLTETVMPAAGQDYEDVWFSPDGAYALMANRDHIATLWRTADWSVIRGDILTGDTGYWGAAFSTASGEMALWYEGAVQILSLETGTPREGLLQQRRPIVEAAFAGDGRWLVTADGSLKVRVWDVAEMTPVGEPIGHDYGLPEISRPGDRMLTWGYEGAVLWDVAAAAELARLPMRNSEDVLGAVFSADGQVAAVFTDEVAQFWNAADGAPLGVPYQVDDVDGLSAVILSGDGRSAALGLGRGVQVISTQSGEATGPLLPHGLMVSGAVFSSDGSQLMTWGDEGLARLWDVRSGQRIGDPVALTIEQADARFLAGDSRVLLSDPAGSLLLVDAATGMVVAQRFSPAFHLSPVVSADGSIVTTFDDPGVMQDWDLSLALKPDAAPADIAAVCAAKLQGTAVPALQGHAAPFVRQLDAQAVFAAPILRGREGEDVCTPPEPAWWEDAAARALGWMFE